MAAATYTVTLTRWTIARALFDVARHLSWRVLISPRFWRVAFDLVVRGPGP